RFLLIALDAEGRDLCGGAFGAPDRRNGTFSGFLAASSDRVWLAGSIDSDINFGGETLRPATGIDVYIASLGIRRPPELAIEEMTARVVGEDVVLEWNLVGSEPLKKVYLSRQRIGAPDGRVIDIPAAVAGKSSFRDDAPGQGASYRYV